MKKLLLLAFAFSIGCKNVRDKQHISDSIRQIKITSDSLRECNCKTGLPSCVELRHNMHTISNEYDYGESYEIILSGTNEGLRVDDGDIDSDGGMFMNDDEFGMAGLSDSCEVKRLFHKWVKHQLSIGNINVPKCITDELGWIEPPELFDTTKVKIHGDTIWYHNLSDLADSNGNIKATHKVLIQQ